MTVCARTRRRRDDGAHAVPETRDRFAGIANVHIAPYPCRMRRLAISLPFLAFALAVPVRADDARSLLTQSETKHRTKTQEYAGELTVVSKQGKVRKKSWKSWRQGYAGDARQLIRFTAPPEVKGVGF